MKQIERFAEEIGSLRRQQLAPEEILERGKELLSPLLKPDSFPARLFEKPTAKPVLLHKSPAMTIFSISSPPGFVSHIHSHGSWGLVGQVAGEEVETLYRAEPAQDGLVKLVRLSSTRWRPGDVAKVLPPDRELHQVATVSEGPSVTVHAFAEDVMAGFSYFEPRLFSEESFSGGYENWEEGT